MKKLISLVLALLAAVSLLTVASAEEEINWAYGVTIEGVGTILCQSILRSRKHRESPDRRSLYR